MTDIPNWLQDLTTDDINFIKRFILASGSLKEIATQYNVTYPTVRLRLNKLIEKIELVDQTHETEFVTLVKRLTIKDKLDLDVARTIINAHQHAVNKITKGVEE